MLRYNIIHSVAADFCLQVFTSICRMLLLGSYVQLVSMALKTFSEVAPQTSVDIAFGPLSETLGNH